MNQNLSYIDLLIGKSLSGNATSDELQELEAWKNSSQDNLILYTRTLKIWNQAKKLISINQFNLDKIKLESEYSRYLAGKIRRMRRLSFIYKAVAILAFPFAFALMWHFYNLPEQSGKTPDQICRITALKGHVSKCILPDGTGVWINSGSFVKYNTSSYIDEREVHLEGEAYFEVTSDPDKPFKVVTPFAEVNATGTAFNVHAYTEDEVFETVLVEGSVNLQFKTGADKFFELQPGQRAFFNLKDFRVNIESVDPEMFTSWRNGELIFKDATLKDLVKELEKIYNINFHMKPESIGDLRFRGMFSYDNNLILALEKIKKASGIDYYIENKEVWLKKNQNRN